MVDITEINFHNGDRFSLRKGILNFSSSFNYDQGSFVFYNDNLYFSKVSDNLGNDPELDTSEQYWVKIGKLDKSSLTDSSYNEIYGGTDNTSSSLRLYGNSNSTNPGEFKINANDGTNICSLTGTPNGSLVWGGTFTADEVYNAMFNDYAEFFEKGEEVENGDIIAVIPSEKEKYGKATENSECIVGVCNSDYAMIVGGQKGLLPKEQKDFIPVALCGRVYVKVNSKPEIGDYITASSIPGVGKPCKRRDKRTVGKVINTSTYEDNHKVRILVL